MVEANNVREGTTTSNFAAWGQIVREHLMELEYGRTSAGPFCGTLRSCDLLETRLAHLSTDRHKVSLEGATIARVQPSHVFLSMVLKGEATVIQGSRATKLLGGDLVLFDSGRPYEFIVEQPLEQILLRLRRSDVEDRLGNLSDVTACKVSSGGGVGRLMKTIVHDIYTQIDAIGLSAARTVHNSLLDLVGAGFTDLRHDHDAHLSEYQYKLMQRIIEYIDRHALDPALTCTSVASSFGISERYIRKLFSDSDRSVFERIWHRRLEEAKRRLATGGAFQKSVRTIAFECGFKDAPHFGRSFKDKYGMTPREFRMTFPRTSDLVPDQAIQAP